MISIDFWRISAKLLTLTANLAHALKIVSFVKLNYVPSPKLKIKTFKSESNRRIENICIFFFRVKLFYCFYMRFAGWCMMTVIGRFFYFF